MATVLARLALVGACALASATSFAQSAPPAPGAPLDVAPAPQLPAVQAPLSEPTPTGATLPPPPPGSAITPSSEATAPPVVLAPVSPAPPTVGSGLLAPVAPETLTLALAPRPRRVTLMPQRLRLLNATLPPLAARSRTGRIIDGVLNVVVGVGIGAVGFFVPASPGNDQRPFFWALGAVQAAQGVVTLAWTPARELLPGRYMNMPMETARERRLRVRFGEQSLDEIAADGARRRVFQAVLGAITPLLVLGVMYREQIFNGRAFTPNGFDALMIGLTVVSSGVSLIPLFGRSDDERLREQYAQQVRLMRQERGLPAQ